MKYTVKQLSEIAGVSVRTLHYYDEIGLLKPSFVKENGYRYYEEKELMRLQQILFFKELEFPLEDIVKMMSASNFNTIEALKDQKKLLELKRERLVGLIQTIEKTMNNLKGGERNMTNNDLFASFSDDQMEQYKEEAKQRWGDTDAYKQSMERTKNWTKEDYKKAQQGWKEFTQQLADTMDKGYDSPEFQELIHKQHESVNQFYDCSVEMFRELGNMYATDPRFRANYEKFRPGLAEFMQKGINYYCDKNSK